MEARKRRHKKEPEEGTDGKKKEAFILRHSFDNIGHELIPLAATTLREIGKQDVEARKTAGCSDFWLLTPVDVFFSGMGISAQWRHQHLSCIC